MALACCERRACGGPSGGSRQRARFAARLKWAIMRPRASQKWRGPTFQKEFSQTHSTLNQSLMSGEIERTRFRSEWAPTRSRHYCATQVAPKAARPATNSSHNNNRRHLRCYTNSARTSPPTTTTTTTETAITCPSPANKQNQNNRTRASGAPAWPATKSNRAEQNS